MLTNGLSVLFFNYSSALNAMYERVKECVRDEHFGKWELTSSFTLLWDAEEGCLTDINGIEVTPMYLVEVLEEMDSCDELEKIKMTL